MRRKKNNCLTFYLFFIKQFIYIVKLFFKKGIISTTRFIEYDFKIAYWAVVTSWTRKSRASSGTHLCHYKRFFK